MVESANVNPDASREADVCEIFARFVFGDVGGDVEFAARALASL